MFDVVIRGGTVVDGTGAAPFTADVAIAGGKIVEVGKITGPARREIDAAGLNVTPGWLDIHTHYDGQATWDPELDPSFSSGVTTAIMGNCGVGFAPVRPTDHERLIELMEGVEEVPGTALHEGMKWNWETFPEYLDALDAIERTFDVGCLMPHGPLRLWAMGEKVGTDKCASGEELALMVEQVEAGMTAGAFGLATSRTPLHRTTSGEMTPDFHVDTPELIALTKPVKKHGGYFQVVPEGIAGEDMQGLRHDMSMVEEVVKATGVDLHVLLFQLNPEPDYYLTQIAKLEEMGKEVKTVAQFSGRATGSIMSFLGANPFMNRPTYLAITKRLPVGEWLAELAKPEVKAQILTEQNPVGTPGLMFDSAMERIYDLTDAMDFEPGPDRSMLALAASTGKSVAETMYDFMLEHSEHPRGYIAFTSYAHGDLEDVRKALYHPNVVLSASDAGAHVLTVADGSINTFMLTHWCRDRTRGPKVALEDVVHWMTKKSADAVGLADRGVIAPGMKADINVFDLDALTVHRPDFYTDLPGGARRIMTQVTGYRATLVSGILTRENDKPTGARPGKLVRHGVH
jgi:N-acyl-D-aspartate/D-glutamate deacylase